MCHYVCVCVCVCLCVCVCKVAVRGAWCLSMMIPGVMKSQKSCTNLSGWKWTTSLLNGLLCNSARQTPCMFFIPIGLRPAGIVRGKVSAPHHVLVLGAMGWRGGV